MRYVDLAKDCVCMGAIKCTYAEIFDKNGVKIFSLQKEDMQGDYAVKTSSGKDVSETKNIPVELTDEAVMAIVRKVGAHAQSLAGETVYVKHAAFDWTALQQKPPRPPKPDTDDQETGEQTETRKPKFGMIVAGAALLYLLFKK